MEKRDITADDLLRIRVVQDPKISPDGRRVVFVLREVDRGRDGYRSSIRLVSTDGGEERALTEGPHVDCSPRWSPDGRWIAFVSSRAGADQLWTTPAAGGTARPLTALDGGVSSPVWAPDGRRLAFLSRRTAARPAYPTAPGMHVITRLKYKTDRTGLWDGRYAHLHVVEIDDGGEAPAPRVLVAGAFDVQFPIWSPDGARLAFLANPSADADASATLDVWTVRVSGGDPGRVSAMPGPKAGLAWSPDGAQLAFAGHQDPLGGYHTTWGLWTIPASGGQPQRVTDCDLGFGDRMLTDLFGFDWSAGPVWANDDRLYALANVRGSTHLLSVHPKTGHVETVTPGDQHVYAFDVNGTTAVWAVTSPVQPPVLWARGSPHPLADPNREMADEVSLVSPEPLTVANPDGTESEAWVLWPSAPKGEPVPMILHVHGGPHAQYGHSFMHEFQLLAAGGYAVLYVNPRGSTGYGDTFARASTRAWGQGDFADLMAAVDHVVRSGRVDAHRLGVTGGSYGGYMTNWIITQTDRFRAAVTDRSLCNLLSFMGTSEIAHTFGLCELGEVDYGAPARHLHASPLTYVERVQTPLLILHSERDQQTGIEQAEQFYLALKRRGRAVEFVRFDDETHELSRSGRPSRRLVRLFHILRWFDQYL